jgi:hypothetical protein
MPGGDSDTPGTHVRNCRRGVFGAAHLPWRWLSWRLRRPELSTTPDEMARRTSAMILAPSRRSRVRTRPTCGALVSGPDTAGLRAASAKLVLAAG